MIAIIYDVIDFVYEIFWSPALLFMVIILASHSCTEIYGGAFKPADNKKPAKICRPY